MGLFFCVRILFRCCSLLKNRQICFGTLRLTQSPLSLDEAIVMFERKCWNLASAFAPTQRIRPPLLTCVCACTRFVYSWLVENYKCTVLIEPAVYEELQRFATWTDEQAKALHDNIDLIICMGTFALQRNIPTSLRSL